MAVGFAQTMYEKEARTQKARASGRLKAPRVDHLVLTKLRDGNRHTFRDDGPFPDDAMYLEAPANTARQHLIWVCRQKDHEGLPEYFSETYCEPIYDQATGQPVDVPSLQKPDGSPSYIADAIKSQMALYVAEQGKVAREAAHEIAKLRKNEEDKAQSALGIIADVAAKIAAAQNAPKQKGGA